MYIEDFVCVAERSRVLVKEKGKKFFTYKSINEIIKLWALKKELYTLDSTINVNKIIKIESIGVQEMCIIKTFSGNELFLGKDTEVFVDGFWTPMSEVIYHENIHVYDLLENVFKETYITNLEPYKKLKAVKIYAENENGIIVNGFTVRV